METLKMLEKLNDFIEKEKREKLTDFRTTVFDCQNTTTDEFFALSKIIRKNLVAEPDIVMPDQYAEFQKAAVHGEIDILNMTQNQKLYFLTFLQDEDCQSDMLSAFGDSEEKLSRMRKHLPVAVSVLENPDLTDEMIFRKARQFAEEYLAIDRRIITYRKYVKLYRTFLI